MTEGLIEDHQFAAAEAQLRELDAAIRYLTTNDGENQRDWVVASRDLLRAKLHMGRGEYRQAVPLLQRVATTAKADRSQSPESSPAYQAWLLMGQSLLQLQQWEDAATSFQRRSANRASFHDRAALGGPRLVGRGTRRPSAGIVRTSGGTRERT